MSEIMQRILGKSMRFRSIVDDKFKTFRISVNFLIPLSNKTAAANALLSSLLKKSTKRYPDYSELQKYLEGLYNANLSSSVDKLGEVQLVNISISGLSNKYALEKENLSLELVKLLYEAIFWPSLDEFGLFCISDFEREKRQLLELIDAEFNDKIHYARQRCEEIMCADETFGISKYGSRKDVEELERNNLVNIWKDLLSKSQVEIMVLGDCQVESIYDFFVTAFQKQERKQQKDFCTKIISTVTKEKNITEEIDINQSKLVLGFRSGIGWIDKDTDIARLTTIILGGTPSSKLFVNIREKLSLCYYCSASYDCHKGLIFVQSGLAKGNVKKAKNEILFQLKEMQDGNITIEEIDAAKKYLVNNILFLGDSLDGLESFYLNQTFNLTTRDLAQTVKDYLQITKEKIIEAAKKIVLDTTYCLCSKEEK